MKYKEFKNIFNDKKRLKFRLYSLEYIIEMKNNQIIIYPLEYIDRKCSFRSLDEALKNYMIYNESIKNLIKEIEILE